MDCKEVRSEWVWHLGSGRGPRPQPEGRRRQGKERLFLKTCLPSSFRLGIGRGDCSRLRGGAGAVAVAGVREPMGRMRSGRFNEKQAKDKRHRSPPSCSLSIAAQQVATWGAKRAFSKAQRGRGRGRDASGSQWEGCEAEGSMRNRPRINAIVPHPPFLFPVDCSTSVATWGAKRAFSKAQRGRGRGRERAAANGKDARWKVQ